MFEKNINNLRNRKSSLNPYRSLELRQRVIKCFSIILLFLLIAIGTIGGCGGGGGDGDGEGLFDITIAEISFSAAAFRFAIDNLSFNPDLTFDEPEFFPPGPIDGKTVQGVTFSFTVGGIPSTDATVGLSGGPGDTPLISPPIIEGDAAGLLVLIFEPPVNSVSFDFGLNAVGFDDIPDGATIRIFDETNNLLATASADAIVPQSFLFHEGTLGISSDGQKLNAIGKHDSLIKSQNHLSDISDFSAVWVK